MIPFLLFYDTKISRLNSKLNQLTLNVFITYKNDLPERDESEPVYFSPAILIHSMTVAC